MADFRRVVTALAVVALLMGFASTASAQAPFSCNASAVPTILRSEGLTELTGDILLVCTGTAPAGNVANFQVFYTAPVTSRLIGSPLSEALLLINDPTPVAGAVQNVNLFQGQVIGNSVAFIGVPIIAPVTPGAVTTYRITNVRVNASAVGAGLAGTPGNVLGLVSIAGPFSIPVNNPQQVVGFVLPGLAFSLRNAANDGSVGSAGLTFQQCVGLSSGTRVATLRFSELFPTAFKIRVDPAGQATPGETYNTESGLIYPGITGTIGGGFVTVTAGLADFGTRLRAEFNNLPPGVSLEVSTTNLPPPPTTGTDTQVPRAVLVMSADGPFTPATATNLRQTNIPTAPLTITGGTAVAVWEVTAASDSATENLDFAVYAAASANVSQNLPAAGVQATVEGSFAPISSVTTASSSAPIPRFVDTGVPRNFLNFVICRTVLLFPFVTNQAGFDTGLAIANTSQDTLGTSTQAGTCTWNFFGANAPAAITTGSIAAGTVDTALASAAAPNFQGYAIAVCNFQFAHGFAFVSDLGARNLAMGYLALVIPDRTRVASPGAGAAAGTGESLSQ